MWLSRVKFIPTNFFIIDACHNEHYDIILGRPFLKLVNAVLDAEKGRVTIELDGTKFTYDFLPASRIALPLPIYNKEVVELFLLILLRTLSKEQCRMMLYLYLRTKN
jgi:hypothetical protein